MLKLKGPDDLVNPNAFRSSKMVVAMYNCSATHWNVWASVIVNLAISSVTLQQLLFVLLQEILLFQWMPWSSGLLAVQQSVHVRPLGNGNMPSICFRCEEGNWAMKQKPGCLGYRGDDSTQLCGGYNKPWYWSLLHNQDSMESKAGFFRGWIAKRKMVWTALASCFWRNPQRNLLQKRSNKHMGSDDVFPIFEWIGEVKKEVPTKSSTNQQS